jgi:hypothetical protein
MMQSLRDCRREFLKGVVPTTMAARFGFRPSFGFRISAFGFLFAFTLGLPVFAQPNAPHIAYVYPAGGCQGSTFYITVGGQYLGSVSNAFFSGPGIQATVIECNRPMPFKDFNDLRDEFRRLQEKRQAAQRSPSSTNVWTSANQKEMADIRDKLLKNPPNRQSNPAMAETVTIRVNIATNAEPGDREIRLKNPNALSNPMVFCVGQIHETSKPLSRPANPDLDRFLEKIGGKPVTEGTPKSETTISLPTTVNGQIMAGGVDRWKFMAQKGQHLVICVAARKLIPYLADAVPGWFEATVTLYDTKGHELAYQDRFRFRPDPVFCFVAPQDGDYILEIKDSIFRGREDFVYRITLGELPFITSIFPLGGPCGEQASIELTGWNLPTNRVTLDCRDQEPGQCAVTVRGADGRVSNRAPFALDNLPECLEQEPNDSTNTAQHVSLPIIINGRIEHPGDVDVFRFEGHAGQQVVAEVVARRLDSPLDSVLSLTDAAGKQLAFNDDFEDKGSGLETHHADSYLTLKLPADGVYYLQIRDTQHQGGPEYGYRLRISAPRPDFALRVTPSSLNPRAGASSPATAFALRKEGFTNAITLRLKDAPQGFSLSGARIPGNEDKVQFTLKAPPQPGRQVFDLTIEGAATVDGRQIVHEAVPAEDMMQAFFYRQLVPANELKVAIAPNPRPFASEAVKILSATPIKITAGQTARIKVATPGGAFTNRWDLELNNAPAGLAIESISPTANGIEIALSCDGLKSKPGQSGNLILDVLPKRQESGPAAKKQANQRRPVASLPAIPFEIVKQ